MKKLSAVFLSLVAVSSIAVTSASAEDGVASVVVGMPIKGASVAAAMVIGLPVAIVRKSCENSKEQTNKIAGDDANIAMKGLSALVGLPIGIVSGAIDGGQAGFKNSLKCDKAFSKEQFSLGDLD